MRSLGGLLRKDLLILGRSRLLVGLLVLYPVAIALLIGLALSRAPAKPKVAIVDLSPPGASIELGDRHVPIERYYGQLLAGVQAQPVRSIAAAERKVSSGAVLAAVVIPYDITQKLSSATTQAQLQVIYNGDALEQSVARTTIEAAVAQANLALSQQIKEVAAQDIDLLLKGGDLSVLGAPRRLLGLSRIPGILKALLAREPAGPAREALDEVKSFADFAAQNLSLSTQVLGTVSQPIQVRSTLLHGRRTPLDAYAVVVAVSISLMLICVLLAAGGIALEREERTLSRLLRGLISREGLLAEKALLAAVCSFVVALAMLCGVAAFVRLDWSSFGSWLAALALSALAFAALGVTIGVLAREVRAATLLSLLLALPLAFLALVPAGAVASGPYDAIRAVSLVFPFKAALQALDAAVNGASPGLGVSLLHLVILTGAFGVLARLGLRRAE